MNDNLVTQFAEKYYPESDAEGVVTRSGERNKAIYVLREAIIEARKQALDQERGYLVSCPWCGVQMEKRPVSYQIPHLIEHGDKFKSELRLAQQWMERESWDYEHSYPPIQLRWIPRRKVT